MRVNISFFFLLLFKYSYLHFLPTTPIPTSQPRSYCPLALSVGLLYMSLDDPSPSFPHYPPPPIPLGIVSLFLISMSLVIFCLLAYFVDLVPLIGEIIWYLSFTHWLISLSITLCISNPAVTKGRSSFFLSTV